MMPKQPRIGSLMAVTTFLLAYCPALMALNPHEVLTQYSRAVWTQAQGLPQDAIQAITQTDDGYLWLGTDEGLSRFDGYDFVTFTKGDGLLPSNSIKALARGRDGVLWIGTPEGLTRYYKRRFTTFTTRTGLPDNVVTSLVEDHNGILWIVAGAYLSRFENGKFDNYAGDRLSPVHAARVVYEDPQHTIWVAGLGGLVKLVNGAFVPILGAREMEDNLVNTMIKDRDGDIWLGGLKGLMLHRPGGKVQTFYAHGHPENAVSTLLQDRDGNIWAGTLGGLSRLEGRGFTPTVPGHRADVDSVRTLFEDREGSLWAGMASGLNRFHDERFTNYGRTEGLPNDKPITVHQDGKGDVWIGYNGGGLVAFRDGKSRVYTTRDGLASNDILDIHESRNGDLLISTSEGLSRMHAGRFSNYVVPDPLGRPFMFDALEDRVGQLWLATPSGVYVMKGSAVRNVVPGGPVFNNSAVVLLEGNDGSLWAGSYGEGLWHIQDGKARRLTMADGLSSDRIRCLFQDPDGTLWIGTWGGGLNAYRDGVFTQAVAKDGLLSDNIWHIEDDGNGSLWLSTPRGICRISKHGFREFVSRRTLSLTARNYGVADGLRSAQCAPSQLGGGGTRTMDGRLWFPTNRGLAVTNPRAAVDPQSETAPIVQLIEVSADNRKIDIGNTATVGAGPRHIQFRYSGIHLSGPERVRYEYKLEGLDSDWIPAATRRSVDYTGLSHGWYRFRVRASISGQPSSETSMALEVLPHYYERAYFIWLCAASVLAGAYVVYQLHLRQIRARFELVLDERARIAREIHDTLMQGFVGISAQLAVALKLSGRDEVALRHIMVARKMARHSLIEAKRSMQDLRSPGLDGGDLPSALLNGAGRWSSGNATSIDVEILGAPRKLDPDLEQNVFRIAQEAVTNALNHAEAAKISVRLEFSDERLILSVIDDGRGFDPSKALSLSDGHFGLQGMRERAERTGGRLDLFSKPGEGTNVNVSFLLRSETLRTTKKRRLLDRMRALFHPVRT